MVLIPYILSTIAGGELIDAIGPRRLFPYYLIPLGLGFLAAWFHIGIWLAFAYMFLMGLTLGISKNLRTTLWAEIYGTEAVGAVRSLFSSFTIICMAIGPLMMGWLIDNHVTYVKCFVNSGHNRYCSLAFSLYRNA